MDKEAKAFRREVHRQLGRRGPGQRYPAELRDRALAYLARARSRGDSIATAATDLDLPLNTLGRWAAKSNGDACENPEPAFQEIRIEDPIPQTDDHLVIAGPGGIEVRGLDLDGVVALMKALA